jgi:flagellar biosynthetic protein FliR
MEMDLQDLYLFIFVMIRVGAIFTVAPFFSSSFIPNTVKAGLVVLLSFVISMSGMDFGEMLNSTDVIMFVIHEVAIGMLIGLVSSIIFRGAQIAGGLVDFSGGLSMAQVYSPLTGGQASVYGRLFPMIALTVFVVMDGPMLFIQIIARSYETIPNIVELTSHGILVYVATVVSSCVSIGLQIAIPFVVMFLISDITLGLISRTIPQINVFILGIPLRFLIGVLMVVILAGSLVANFEVLVELMFEAIEGFVNALQ